MAGITGQTDDAGRSTTGSAGAIHGFEVAGSIPLSFLREPTALERTLHVSTSGEDPTPTGAPILEWPPRPLRAFEARLFAEDGRYLFWTNTDSWFEVDPRMPSITVTEGADPVRRESRMWGVPSLLCYVALGDFPMHAAAVDVGGRAIVFPAPGRSGKTTTAAAFSRAGYRVLTEDLARCSTADDPVVYPGPAVLRLRRDVAERVDVPGTYVVGGDVDRAYLAFEPSRRGDGAPVPIAAIVLLRREEGAVRMERRTARETIPDLWALSMNLPDPEDRARCFRGVTDLATAVPVWDLRRPFAFDDLEDVVSLVLETCL